MQEDILQGHVLSIQSHVVSGYVGNRAAVFPLQLLGFETDFINSVQFSNHTGYKTVKGQVLAGKDVEDLYAGLEANQLHKDYTHVLTGYIGSESFLRSVLSVVHRIKKQKENVIYVCDPVLGDNGKYYVPEPLVAIFRDDVIQHADIIKMNQFEAELLSGIKIECEQDAIAAVQWFHKQKQIPIVVLTSAAYKDTPNMLTMIASNTTNMYKITFPCLQGNFTGTGDCVAALLLAWTHIHKDNFALAMEKTLAGIQAVLLKTPAGQELRLIQCRNTLQDPPITFKAQQILL